MPLPLANYSPKLVVVNIWGALLSGVGKDIFVSSERDEDAFMLFTGADGNSALAMNLNESGTLKITLAHTSPSNDILLAGYQKHRLTRIIPPGGGFIKDLNGGMLVFAKNLWVKKLPNIQRGKDIGEVEWELASDRIEMAVLGNLL